ncbi:Heparin sulfate O-sulfotransferase [Holothuria leucospilota]|uniref:Heparin sulfate O-sulfotransferase n=1 Tax=Holothuria leucospilota TaxID=206669 RepID=A0A9Q0YI12_HOLLE|nr:Heparin sulfate O-sulfotransferase [Holothuria leucospilota]
MVQNIQRYGYLLGITCFLSLSGLCYLYSFSRHRTTTELLKVQSERGSFPVYNYMQDEIKMEVSSSSETDSKRRILPTVLFNVQPKSGSRTLYELVQKLGNSTRKNITIKNTMGGYSQTFFEKVSEIKGLVHSNEMGFLYSHMRYQGFRNDKNPPKYISIVREPIDRLVSLYYFVRYGDNIKEDGNGAGKEFRERMKKMNFSNESFDECVLNGRSSCRDPGAIVRHFCGYDKKICIKTSRSKAYDRAVYNINKHYDVVGIMEDYLSTLKLLEKLIPEIFEGVVNLYMEEKRVIVSKMKTKNKTSISMKARNMLKKEMAIDYKLYNYIKHTFKLKKKRLGID